MCDLAIEIRHLVKIYKMYNKPTDRILEAFHLGNKERYKELLLRLHQLQNAALKIRLQGI